MTDELIPDHIRRFLLTSIESVPHLEALLLVRQKPEVGWDAPSLAGELFIEKKLGESLLQKLHDTGILARIEKSDPARFRYSVTVPQLVQLLDDLAVIYSRHLIPVTKLIHSKSAGAQQFADAFKIKKED